MCNPLSYFHCTVLYSVPRKTWHPGEIFHHVLLSSLPCYLWIYQRKFIQNVYFRRHSAAHLLICIHMSINKFSVVLCLVLSQKPADYRHKTSPSCPLNLRLHLGKIDEINRSFQLRSDNHSIFDFCLWQFWIQLLNLLKCLTLCVNLFKDTAWLDLILCSEVASAFSLHLLVVVASRCEFLSHSWFVEASSSSCSEELYFCYPRDRGNIGIW